MCKRTLSEVSHVLSRDVYTKECTVCAGDVRVGSVCLHAGAHIQNIWGGGGAFRSGTDFFVRI